MMRGVLVVAAVLALAPAAHAACPVTVSRDHGSAPLRVTFRAACDSKLYRWRLGDGDRSQHRDATCSAAGASRPCSDRPRRASDGTGDVDRARPSRRRARRTANA
jgi:hypothetical protein